MPPKKVKPIEDIKEEECYEDEPPIEVIAGYGNSFIITKSIK